MTPYNRNTYGILLSFEYLYPYEYCLKVFHRNLDILFHDRNNRVVRFANTFFECEFRTLI